jgi:hypothetical protein
MTEMGMTALSHSDLTHCLSELPDRGMLLRQNSIIYGNRLPVTFFRVCADSP